MLKCLWFKFLNIPAQNKSLALELKDKKRFYFFITRILFCYFIILSFYYLFHSLQSPVSLLCGIVWAVVCCTVYVWYGTTHVHVEARRHVIVLSGELMMNMINVDTDGLCHFAEYHLILVNSYFSFWTDVLFG